jgi:hypothetical protein
MTKTATMHYKLVETIPRAIEAGVLYVSREYGTAVHKCCCGCGQEVVTPLGSTDWKISIDADAVSVYPSIGNWSLPCRSHYWIDRGRIHWAEEWSDARIRQGREYDRMAKQRHHDEIDAARRRAADAGPGFWASLWRWLTGR